MDKEEITQENKSQATKRMEYPSFSKIIQRKKELLWQPSKAKKLLPWAKSPSLA